jgi:hypothetical protein
MIAELTANEVAFATGPRVFVGHSQPNFGRRDASGKAVTSVILNKPSQKTSENRHFWITVAR